MSAAARLAGLIQPEPARSAADRFRCSLDLLRASEQLLVGRWRREEPGISDREVQRRLEAWLQDRPMDCLGTVRTWSTPNSS